MLDNTRLQCRKEKHLRKERDKMRIGVNTFGLSGLLTKDFTGTLAALRRMGYETVEPCVLFEEAVPARELRATLRSYGLDDGFLWSVQEAREKIGIARDMGFSIAGIHPALFNSKHFSWDATILRMKDFAREMDIRYYVYSPQKSSVCKLANDIDRIRITVAELNKAGVSFLLHNHAQELMGDEDNTVLSFLMDEVPGLELELDVGWAVYAGADAVELMRKYRDRISVLHLKDIIVNTSGTEKTPRFTAIGEGAIPLAEIMREVASMPLSADGLVVDQDASDGDMLEDLRIGLSNIRQYLI